MGVTCACLQCGRHKQNRDDKNHQNCRMYLLHWSVLLSSTEPKSRALLVGPQWLAWVFSIDLNSLQSSSNQTIHCCLHEFICQRHIARNFWTVSYLACSTELPEAGILGKLRDIHDSKCQILNYFVHAHSLQIIVTRAKSLFTYNRTLCLHAETL